MGRVGSRSCAAGRSRRQLAARVTPRPAVARDDQHVDPGEVGGQRRHAHHGQAGHGQPALLAVAGDAARCQLPHRGHDQGDHHRSDSVQDAAAGGGGAIADIGPGQGEHDRHGGQDEAGPAQHQPGPARPPPRQHDGQLGRAGARQDADRAEQVQELGVGEPVPAPDRLVPQHGHVHGRAAEGDRAELAHHRPHLAQRACWPRWGRLGGVGAGHGQRPTARSPAVAAAGMVSGSLPQDRGGGLTGRAGTARPRCRQGPAAGSASRPAR
jgi:hypothetical protein